MKITLKSLWQSGASLARLAEIEFTPEKLNYKIGRIHRAATSEIETLQKSYLKLIKKYGEEITNGDGKGTGNYTIKPDSESEAQFTEEWDGLLAQEVEIWGEPIALSELKDFAGKIKAKDMGALSEWLITE